MINKYYHWLVLRKWISHCNIASEAKIEMWDAMRSPLSSKHINDSISIEDLTRPHQWRQYNITFLHTEINHNTFVSRLLLDKCPLHTKCVGTRLGISSSLLCEPWSLRVVIATISDADISRNRWDLIQNLVPTHYVCNKFI